jgi:hypothetical protein
MIERGQTPGKALVGIHIVGGTSRPVGLIRGAILRNLAVPALLVALEAIVVRSHAVSGTDLDEPSSRASRAFLAADPRPAQALPA